MAVVFLQDVVFRNDVLCVHCFNEHYFSDLHIIHMVCLGPMFLSLPLFLALLTRSSIVLIAGSWLQVCEKVPSEWLCGWLVVSSYHFHFGQCSALPDLTCKLIIRLLANVNVVKISYSFNLSWFYIDICWTCNIWKQCTVSGEYFDITFWQWYNYSSVDWCCVSTSVVTRRNYLSIAL